LTFTSAPFSIERRGESRRQIQRFEGNICPTQERRLRRSARTYFQMGQFEGIRKWFTVGLGAGSTVVRHGEHDAPSVKFCEFVAEFLVIDLGEISLIPISADALIRRVHVDKIFVRAFGQHLPVIPRCESCSSTQKIRSTRNATTHFGWPGTFAPIIRRVVELAVRVVSNRRLHTAGKQIQEIGRIVVAVSLLKRSRT